MIKRFLFAAGLLCVFAGVASATVNVRQNGDGTADVVGSRTDSRFGNCFGGANVLIPTQLNSNTVTGYGISPISNAVIRGAYAVTDRTTTGVANLNIFVNQATTPVRFFSSVNGLTTTAVLRFDAVSAGTVKRISTTSEVSGSQGLSNHTLQEGDYIAISPSGAGSTLATAQVILQLCPR